MKYIHLEFELANPALLGRLAEVCRAQGLSGLNERHFVGDWDRHRCKELGQEVSDFLRREKVSLNGGEEQVMIYVTSYETGWRFVHDAWRPCE